MSMKKCAKVSVLTLLNLVLLAAIVYIYYIWMYAFFWDDDRIPHNNREEWEERKNTCKNEYQAWERTRSYSTYSSSNRLECCINEKPSNLYISMDECCNVPEHRIAIIHPNNAQAPYPMRHGYTYESVRIHELKLIRIFHLFTGVVAPALGTLLGWIIMRFFRKLRRPAGPTEMKPIEELESWAATRSKKNKAMISDFSDDETFWWLHLRLKAMRSKTEKLDALSQTLKETNDYLTSDFVDLILTAFPEEEEAMEAFVIIEPYLLTSMTPRDTEYSLNVVVED